jgi:hypothetical protein
MAAYPFLSSEVNEHVMYEVRFVSFPQPIISGMTYQVT